MRTYTITPVSGTPDWSRIPALEVDQHLWLPSEEIAMTVQICYDEHGFYVHMKAKEADVRAEYTAPLSLVHKDSCMEWFFCPVEADPRYINVEMNPNGCAFIGISTCRADNVRLCSMYEEELFQKKTARTDDGWEIFYTVPVSFLRVFFPGYTPTAGMVIRANCYKCGDLTAVEHYLSWNPVTSAEPDFHRSCDFGRMILG